jgi:hypothetical protein
MIDLIITIEKHAGLQKYKSSKEQGSSVYVSNVTVDLHDNDQMYWGMLVKWPYDALERPNFVRDIVAFCQESLNDKSKILFCLKCEKYKHLKSLAELLMKVKSVTIEDHFDDYVVVHDPILDIVKVPINKKMIEVRVKEKRIRQLLSRMAGEVLTKQTKDGKTSYRVVHVEKPSVQEQKEIFDELEKLQQPMKPQFMEDIIVETVEECIPRIPYKDMTDTQRGNIRMACKIEFIQNNISPKDMWNPMPDKEETNNLVSTIGNHLLLGTSPNQSVMPKPKPLYPKIPGIGINGTDDSDADFFNKLGGTI